MNETNSSRHARRSRAAAYSEASETERLTPEELALYTPNEPEASSSGLRSASALPLTREDSAPASFPSTADPGGESFYRRPSSDAAVPEGQAPTTFAPPPRFAYAPPSALSNQEKAYAPTANVYQPYQPSREPSCAWPAEMDRISDAHTPYSVNAEKDDPRKKRRKRRVMKRVLATLSCVAVLGAAAYFTRDFWLDKLWGLTGQSVPAPLTAWESSVSTAKGYDAAPAQKISKKAREGIVAVSGTVEMSDYAVTDQNVVTRVSLGDGKYDYYLFSADKGRLLGYYEALTPAQFMVGPKGSFYVALPPYLVGSDGAPLIDTSYYRQYTGPDVVLGPLQYGWSLISDADGTTFNYISAEGKLLSTLWFDQAIPFRGKRTLAYVDTGNGANPAERYSLYLLGSDGGMTLWKHTADLNYVVDAACELALLSTGDVVSLENPDAALCKSSQLTAYLDCGAVVVRDDQSGLSSLFVGAKQHYDFAYTTIEPVLCDIRWAEGGSSAFRIKAVTDANYPQPLSHYFVLTQDGKTEQVALSTAEVYPISCN